MMYSKKQDAGRDPRSVPMYRPDIEGEISEPERIHHTDKYDNDFVWDGESMDEEKP